MNSQNSLNAITRSIRSYNRWRAQVDPLRAEALRQETRHRELESALREARAETAAVSAQLTQSSDAREASSRELATKARALQQSVEEVAVLRAQRADEARLMRELEDRCGSVRIGGTY